MQAIPEQGTALLEQARAAFEEAIPTLIDFGRPEELAEAEMNLGVVVQNLPAPVARASRTRSRPISARCAPSTARDTRANSRSCRTIWRPRFLSMPFTDERGKMREALAVQAFEEGLKVVNR